MASPLPSALWKRKCKLQFHRQLSDRRRLHARLVSQASSRGDNSVAPQPQSPVLQAGQKNIATSGPQVDSVASGMNAQCHAAVVNSVPSHEPLQKQQQQQQQQQAASSGFQNSSEASNQNGQHVDCVATGMDVQCFIADEDSTSSSSKEGTATSDAPRTAAAAASGESGPLMQLLGAALLVSPFFFWGTSMVAMKPVTAHTTPLLLGAMRLLPAGVVLLGWAAATGRAQPQTATAWAWVLAFALVDGAAFQGFLAEGLQRTSAGLGSVIIDSQPLSVALLAALLFGEALSPLGVAGLFVGVAGLLLLELPQDLLSDSTAALQAGGVAAGLGVLQQGLSGAAAAAAGSASQGSWSLTSSGEFWMLLAAQSMAVGTVMVRWVSKHCDPVAATAWHMVLGGIMLAIAAFVADGDSGVLSDRLSQFNSTDAVAMAYVSLFGGAASYGIFFYEATHGSLTAISSLTFLTPVFAAAAGYLLLGETLTPIQLLGATVTLSAVFAINTPASHTDGSGDVKKDA